MFANHRTVISFGLVAIPIAMYTATQDNDIHFNQLHKEDQSRIRYKKTCAHCGKEILSGDIVKGYDIFGDRYGWSLQEYLDIDKSNSDADTLYNTTKESFLCHLANRYSLTAIDWAKGSCDFQNADFIDILSTAKSIRENPEPEDFTELDFTPAAIRVANGTLTAAAEWVDSISKLPSEEDLAGKKLSYIGWPTVDSECGSDILLQNPVGIFSCSENKDGAWDFIKYLVSNDELRNTKNGFPVYSPWLENDIFTALNEDDEKVAVSENDVTRFYALLDNIENISMYDEQVTNIILEEATYFFEDIKSAQETARIIQSRLQSYVSEQS